MANLTKDQLKEYGEKLGVEEITITAAILVDILNDKHGSKNNGKPFRFNDIQQYYIRESIPTKYGGYKIKLNSNMLGKTLTVFADVKGEE